jgi:hypothetical protein
LFFGGLNAKTLDYLVDNQAFVGFIPLSIFAFLAKSRRSVANLILLSQIPT